MADRAETDRGQDARKLAWRAGVLAACVAGGLALMKLGAGILGHSSAVTASALDSGVDVLASATNALAIYFAGAKPDREHPYGHGRIEALATSLQGLLIVGSGLFLLWRGVSRVLSPEPLRLIGLTVWVMAVAAVVTIGLVLYMRRTARRVGSSALLADSVHYSTDIAQNLAVLIGVGLAGVTGWFVIDGALTVVVSLFIVHAGWSLIRPAVDELIDASADAPRVAALESVLGDLERRGRLDGFHGLRTRTSGRTLFVEVHIELPGDMLLARAHRRGDEVRDALVSVAPEAEVLVHIDVEPDEAPPRSG